MSTELKDVFLQLVRLGIGCEAGASLPVSVPLSVEDWQALEDLANEHGLLGVMLDGMETLPRELRPEKKAIIQSIGQMLQAEQQYEIQKNAAAEMAILLHQHEIRTYVLKGRVVAECYPNPEHRKSVDMDCFLMPEQGNADVWEKANVLMERQGSEVRRDYYKNSTILLPGLSVENHRFFTPFRGNRQLNNLEHWLQEEMHRANNTTPLTARFEGTWLYRPPVMVSALFLIEHAYSHFLHEGLTWRLVLDWQMFCCKQRQEIDWRELDARVDEFGFRKFYDSYCRLGEYLVGELTADDLQHTDRKMLSDVWAPLDVHETVKGLRGKLALAGNTWRARWKYRHFSDISWIQALWIQAKGVVFEKNPKI